MKIAYAVAPADITGAFMGLQGPLYEALETVARIGYEGVELFVRDPATLDVVQLKQALQNYDQAFGEYKVGKGDILSVVIAETLLSQAREQDVQAKLNLYLAKALLERVSGIEHLEALQETAAQPANPGTR